MAHTRRDFLRAGVGGWALMSLRVTTPNVFANAVTAAGTRARDRDTILVVIQLSGGNDGLNTVVPYADDEYGRNRTTLRLPTDHLHKIDTALAFHPRMEAFVRLYHEGHLSVVQGVGYARPDQSHERAMRIWHTADPQRPERQTGWLGRVADHVRREVDGDTSAVFVGPIARPFALNAERAIVPCVRAVEDLTQRDSPREMSEVGGAGVNDALLEFVRRRMVTARAKSERIKAVTAWDDYPSFELAGDLRTIARIIRADVGIRVFFAELGGGGIGGFDNHANQLGNHGALLHQLAESLAAFVRDLERDNLLDRVLVMTFSEFGRTLKENGRRGTDHGAAAPMFLVGGNVRGGLVGPHPSLTDLENGSPKFHTDFRRVYATVLDKWLGCDSQAILGQQFETLDFFNA
ncbi:MAG: DUF1501 domain-containing protein [Phycisphaerales bacterium]|nr:MAG: DUF1501 domain-containing protein [Phycisphaerales bacterium]